MDLNGVEDKDGLEKPLLPDMLFMVIVNGEIIWFFPKKKFLSVCIFTLIMLYLSLLKQTNYFFTGINFIINLKRMRYERKSQ